MTVTDGPAEDDISIGLEVVVLRAFSPNFVSRVEGGGSIPSRQAIQSIPDRETGIKAMSVYRADVLDAHHEPWPAVVEDHADWCIVRFTVADLRGLEMGIVPAILPDKGIVGLAHCHVHGLTGSKQGKLRERCEWVKGPAQLDQSGTGGAESATVLLEDAEAPIRLAVLADVPRAREALLRVIMAPQEQVAQAIGRL